MLLVVVLGLNLLVDPFGVYGSRLLEPIALRSRGPKLYLYEQARPAPAVVILGSSRSFHVEPRYVAAKTSRPAFNAAVHGAGARDYLDFARCFDAKLRFPRVLVVALGVEQMLGEGRPFERDDPIAECTNPQRPFSEQARAYRGLLTLEETWASMRVLGLVAAGRPAPAFSFDADGMVRSAPPLRSLEQAVDDSLAANWAPSLFAPERLHPGSAVQLRQFLELCRSHGAEVFVYLPPYHPRAVARYRKESRFVSLRAQVLEQLASWAREYPLRFHDFTEASRFGGGEEMFYDASHPREDANRLMLDIMLAE